MKRPTGINVIDDVWERLRYSPILTFIDGTIYKLERPLNSQKEDCVINFRTGLDGRILEGNTIEGALSLNFWVPFIDNAIGSKTPNITRIREISDFIEPIIRGTTADYLYWYGDMIQAFRENNIEQSFIYVDLRFRKQTGIHYY